MEYLNLSWNYRGYWIWFSIFWWVIIWNWGGLIWELYFLSCSWATPLLLHQVHHCSSSQTPKKSDSQLSWEWASNKKIPKIESENHSWSENVNNFFWMFGSVDAKTRVLIIQKASFFTPISFIVGIPSSIFFSVFTGKTVTNNARLWWWLLFLLLLLLALSYHIITILFCKLWINIRVFLLFMEWKEIHWTINALGFCFTIQISRWKGSFFSFLFIISSFDVYLKMFLIDIMNFLLIEFFGNYF